MENRIGEWIGPYTVETIDHSSKIVTVKKDENSQFERYNMTQVKPILRPVEATNAFMDVVHQFFVPYASDSRTIGNQSFALERDPKTSLNAGETNSQDARTMNNTTCNTSTQATDVIEQNDPRASSPQMKAAIMSEVQDLMRRDTLKVVDRSELS